jgi:hypothetical protein
MSEQELNVKYIEQILEGLWMQGRMVKSVLPNEEGDFMYTVPEKANLNPEMPFETHDQYLNRTSKVN